MTISAEKISAELASLEPAAAAAATGLKLLPDFIQSAESVIGPGNGSVKLDLVRAWVVNALTKAQLDLPIIEAAWAKMEPAVAILVTIFTKSPALASLLGLTVKKAAAASPVA